MGMDDYRYYVDVTMEKASASHFPNVALHKRRPGRSERGWPLPLGEG